MNSDTGKSWPLRDALDTARAVLKHELGMIEGNSISSRSPGFVSFLHAYPTSRSFTP
jgi:hypothetical protein